MSSVDVSVVIPAYKRPRKLIDTLARINACEPRPREILVYVDENNADVLEALKDSPVSIRTISSPDRLGPGGGRNLLIREASCPFVVSFDDDSYPLQRDFFRRVATVMEQFPKAAVVGAEISSPQRPRTEAVSVIAQSRFFYGCGCVYRKEIVEQLPGYIPIPLAYAVEETDLTLQALANGHDVMVTEWLQVFHDREAPNADAEINYAMVRNSALLPFLRYPVILFPIGFAQWLRIVIWYCTHGRRNGVWRGVRDVPSCLREYKSHRKPFSTAQILRYLAGRLQTQEKFPVTVAGDSPSPDPAQA